MFKRMIAVVLCAIMLVGVMSGCKGKETAANAGDTVITRGEWIQMLTTKFTLTAKDNTSPYFSDVNKDDEIFSAVQAAVDLGIIEKGGRFNKLAEVSYKDVALNSINTIGIDTVKAYLGISDEPTEKQLLDFAVSKGIVSNVKDKRATVSIAEKAIDTAISLYLNKPFNEKTNIDMIDDVVDISDENIAVSESAFTYSNASSLKAGDVVILPGDDDSPDGYACKVESVQGNTVNFTEAELSDVYETFEVSAVVVPEQSDIEPAAGVAVSDYENLNLSAASSHSKPTDLARTGRAGNSISNLSNKGASFSVQVNLSDGKLKVDEKWNSLKGTFSGQNVGDEETIPFRLDSNGKPYTSKYKSGYDIKGKISISDLSITNDIDFGLIKGLKKVETKVNFKADVSLSVKGNIDGDIDVFTASVPIAGTGISVSCVFTLVFDLNGEISVKCSLSNKTTFTYKNGLQSANETTLENKAEAAGEFTAKVGPKAVIVILGIDIVDVQALIGLKTKATVAANQGKTDVPCMDVNIYSPIVTLVLAGDKATLVNKLGFSAEWKIYDTEGGWQKPLSTVTIHWEYQKGWSDKCTLKDLNNSTASKKPTASVSSKTDASSAATSSKTPKPNISSQSSSKPAGSQATSSNQSSNSSEEENVYLMSCDYLGENGISYDYGEGVYTEADDSEICGLSVGFSLESEKKFQRITNIYATINGYKCNVYYTTDINKIRGELFSYWCGYNYDGSDVAEEDLSWLEMRKETFEPLIAVAVIEYPEGICDVLEPEDPEDLHSDYICEGVFKVDYLRSNGEKQTIYWNFDRILGGWAIGTFPKEYIGTVFK